MSDSLKVRYTSQIKGGLQFSGVHEKIAAWIKKVPGAHFDAKGGCSYINGTIYYAGIVFSSAEDLLAFKLTFAGLVY